jgi:hypothetical protein
MRQKAERHQVNKWETIGTAVEGWMNKVFKTDIKREKKLFHEFTKGN